jgi:hypothetical protein
MKKLLKRLLRSGCVRFPAFLIPVLASVLLASCGDGGSGPKKPKAGEAVFTLTGALPDDGAVLLEIGAGPSGVTAGSSQVEVHAVQTPRGFTVAVFGPLAGQELLRIALPDRTTLPSVTLKEIATESGDLRDEISAYQPRLKVKR